MSIEIVKKFLKKHQMENRVVEFDKSSATVLEAANRLNCEPSYIAKSLSFLVNNRPIVIVTSGDTKIDNAKFKDFFKVKANMIAPLDVEKLVGHEIGGVCPFALNDDVIVYLDESIKRFEFSYPACGSSNSAIKLTIKELEMLTNYPEWIDVSKRY